MGIFDLLFLLVSAFITLISNVSYYILLFNYYPDIDSLLVYLLFSNIEILLVFGFMYLVANAGISIPKNIGDLNLIGLFHTLSFASFLYSFYQNRTAFSFQLITTPIYILTSIYCTRFIINKRSSYHPKYMISSFYLLVLGVIISVLPFQSLHVFDDIPFYSLLFIFGIMMRSIHSVYQETYMIHHSKSSGFVSKLEIGFYSQISSVILCGFCMFVYEFMFGKSDSPFETFRNETTNLFIHGVNAIEYQALIMIYILGYMSSINVSSYSTNYTMCINMLSMPIIGIYYLLYPNEYLYGYTGGDKVYNILLLFFGIFILGMGIILWLNAETINNYIVVIPDEPEIIPNGNDINFDHDTVVNDTGNIRHVPDKVINDPKKVINDLDSKEVMDGQKDDIEIDINENEIGSSENELTHLFVKKYPNYNLKV